jgi:hypothetical protein
VDHLEARGVFARILAGAPVDGQDEDRALAHAATCETCARELGRDAGEGPVDPSEVFDRALTSALRAHPEAIGRLRAAEQLAAHRRASAEAVAALQDAAAGDEEPRVRIAALRALEALGVPRPPARPPGGHAPA